MLNHVTINFEYLANLEPSLWAIEEQCHALHKAYRPGNRGEGWRDIREQTFHTVGWGRQTGPAILQSSEAWDLCLPRFRDIVYPE